MARIFSTGFETGSNTELNYNYSDTTAGIAAEAARTGSYGLWVGAANSGIVNTLFLPSREIYIGYALYPRIGGASHADGFFSLRTSGSTSIFKLTCSDWAISAYYGSTLLFSAPAIALESWHYIEIFARTDATLGAFEVKINGESVGTYSGNTGTSEMGMLYFRSTTGATRMYLDDIVVNDTTGSYNNTWTGQSRLIPVLVNADGSETDLSRGGTDSGANWSQVNTVPINDASYVYGTASNGRDLLTVDGSAVVLPEDTTIQNVIVVLRSRIESGSGAVAAALKSDTAEVDSDTVSALSGTFLTRSYAFPYDPDGEAPWILSRAISAEIGPKLKDLS
jgi:hypothetical protein